MNSKFTSLWILLFSLLLLSCTQKTSEQSESSPVPGTFGYDVAFMQSHKDVLILGRKASPAKVLIVGDYEARVMTSTAGGHAGNSYGWINYDLIQSGNIKPHMNPYGGEDRFWLGPEGGQFALYFKRGDPFDFDHWQTPPMIDTEPFDLVSADSLQAHFKKSAVIENYCGTKFQIDIQREIQLLETEEIEKEFDITVGNQRAVSFRSTNSITNAGPEWNKKSGLLSIWILGMFTPSNNAMIILPHRKPKIDAAVTDNYFGTIPGDRIINTDSLLLLKADGKFRGKVGIAPAIAENMVGSYDPDKHVLTLVKFDLAGSEAYVNSKWETQREPYHGDAVNAYNDGPQADGSQLGPFYELESSSPAAELKPGEKLTHRHTTLHLERDEDELNRVAERVLGVKLLDLKQLFIH